MPGLGSILRCAEHQFHTLGLRVMGCGHIRHTGAECLHPGVDQGQPLLDAGHHHLTLCFVHTHCQVKTIAPADRLCRQFSKAGAMFQRTAQRLQLFPQRLRAATHTQALDVAPQTLQHGLLRCQQHGVFRRRQQTICDRLAQRQLRCQMPAEQLICQSGPHAPLPHRDIGQAQHPQLRAQLQQCPKRLGPAAAALVMKILQDQVLRRKADQLHPLFRGQSCQLLVREPFDLSLALRTLRCKPQQRLLRAALAQLFHNSPAVGALGLHHDCASFLIQTLHYRPEHLLLIL